MKKIFVLTVTLVALCLNPAFAQLGAHGGGATGPNLGGAMNKLFGDNQAFSAVMEFHTTGGSSGNITMPGKISFDTGKSRFEMNMSEMQGTKMPAGTAAQMKAMGMDTMITIARPDRKLAYLVYPGLNSYAEIPASDKSDNTDIADYKIVTTELGKETVDGHACVKNKVIVTDKDGKAHESTVWNATDLKKFPIKIVSSEANQTVTMIYKNVSFAKPAATDFETPAGFTKYDNVQTMMQAEMMKKMGGMARPPGR